MAWGPGRDNRFSGAGGGGWDEGRWDEDAEAALAQLASDARTDERVAQRRRGRWLARAAAESTTLTALLDSLAELARPVTVVLSTGKHVQGVITVVGANVVALRDGSGAPVLVALERLVAVEEAGRESRHADPDDAGAGALTDGERPTLRHLLAELADEQPDVHVAFDGGAFNGRLRWVGADVAALTDRAIPIAGSTSGGPSTVGRTRYVRLSSVTDVSLSVSG